MPLPRKTFPVSNQTAGGQWRNLLTRLRSCPSRPPPTRPRQLSLPASLSIRRPDSKRSPTDARAAAQPPSPPNPSAPAAAAGRPHGESAALPSRPRGSAAAARPSVRRAVRGWGRSSAPSPRRRSPCATSRATRRTIWAAGGRPSAPEPAHRHPLLPVRLQPNPHRGPNASLRPCLHLLVHQQDLALPPRIGKQRGGKGEPLDLAAHPHSPPQRPYLRNVQRNPRNHPAQPRAKGLEHGGEGFHGGWTHGPPCSPSMQPARCSRKSQLQSA